MKITSIYLKRKHAAAVIRMSRHGLKRKCMAAVISKARRLKNKMHSPMKGYQMHGLKYQNTAFNQKRKEAAAVIGMSWNGLKRKCMAATNSKARQPKNIGHGPM
jgi:hypothetical protein